MTENARDVLIRLDREFNGVSAKAAGRHADRQLAALDAAGLAMVPKVPTEEMIAYARAAHVERVRRKVAEGTIGKDPDGTLVEQYLSMLAAARSIAE